MSEATVGTLILGVLIAGVGWLIRDKVVGVDGKIDTLVDSVNAQGNRLTAVEVKVENLEDRGREITAPHSIVPHRNGR